MTQERTLPRLATWTGLGLTAVFGFLVYELVSPHLVFTSRGREPSGTLVCSPEAAGQGTDRSTPSGCDILDVSFLVESSSEQGAWRRARFSLCQLPGTWRPAFQNLHIGQTADCRSSATAPKYIGDLLGSEGPLRARIRLESIVQAPELRLPRTLDGGSGTATTVSGVRYALLTPGRGSHYVDKDSVLLLSQSTWSIPDKRLVTSTRVSGLPNVANMARAKPFIREVLLGAAEGDRFLVWLPNGERLPRGVDTAAVDVEVLRVVR